ncbi:MAG: ATP-dependent helicase [Pseudomonadota bacterium]
MQLNPAQLEAAEHGDGPLLVIAGAGTGKTMTLAHRVAHLIRQGADPERILLLTFTRRAAETMISRVDNIVRAENDEAHVKLPWAGTFHSVANRLLRRFAPNVGLDPGFSVLDQSDAADLLDVVRHEQKLSSLSRRFPKKGTCLAIYSRCMNTGMPLVDALKENWPWCSDWEAELKQLFRGYVERKQATFSLDYDDLLVYWAHLVADADFAADIGSWFDHVLVDEYQDTNRLQASIVHALKPDGRGVTVVGDDAQSIYAFRSATVDNILSFPDRFEPRAAVVTLEQNYRSSQPILDTANSLLSEASRQYQKRLFSTRDGGARPTYITVEDGDAEACCVVDRILENQEQGALLRKQAVLFRNAHHSDRLEIELVQRNIPYVKYGGLKFLEAAHVKDVIAILKWADNPKNEIAAFRVLKMLDGIGPRIAAKCYEFLASHDYSLDALTGFRPPATDADDWAAFCATLSGLAGFESLAWQSQFDVLKRWYRPQLERLYDSPDTRWADVEQLEQVSARYPSRERFLTELTLDPPSASGDEAGAPLLDEDYLILSTVHSAKGQEWDHVFVLNVTDGNFPSEFAAGDANAIEEERRLMYVAMTRARRSLSLLAPLKFFVTQQHRHGDNHVYGARSRFLTKRVMATLDSDFYARDELRRRQLAPTSARQLNVAESLKSMW